MLCGCILLLLLSLLRMSSGLPQPAAFQAAFQAASGSPGSPPSLLREKVGRGKAASHGTNVTVLVVPVLSSFSPPPHSPQQMAVPGGQQTALVFGLSALSAAHRPP